MMTDPQHKTTEYKITQSTAQSTLDALGKYDPGDGLLMGDVGMRRIAAYTMRVKSGATYRDISRAQGISLTTAYKDVQAVMDYFRKATYESLEDARQIALERLDMALFAVMPKVKNGDLKAVDAMLRIEKRRAEMLGLDAAKKLEMTGEGGGPLEVSTTVNIREKWSPQEAAQRAGELMRRMEVLNKANHRIAEEKAKKLAERN